MNETGTMIEKNASRNIITNENGTMVIKESLKKKPDEEDNGLEFMSNTMVFKGDS